MFTHRFGRQTWSYDESQTADTQGLLEKYFLGLNCPEIKQHGSSPQTPEEALSRAMELYGKFQTNEGHWANDYGGPLFLMPGWVITSVITGVEIHEKQRLEMVRYLLNQQHTDGGWGFHIEGISGMFGTGLNYVTARLLGVPDNHPRMILARKWIHVLT